MKGASQPRLPYFLFFTTRTISILAILIANARLTRVTPDFLLSTPSFISHRQLPSVDRTTEYSTPLCSIGSSLGHKRDDPGIGEEVCAVCSLVHLTRLSLCNL